MFEKKCTQGGNHHKFRERFDQKEYMPDKILSASISGYDISSFKTYITTYIKDVCEWCGKEIQR